MNEGQWHALVCAWWTLVALVVLWQYDLAHRKLDADASFMLYAGQQILRGHAPYTGVAIVKLPMSPLVAALGIAVGRLFTTDDILSGRIAFWLCAGLAVGAVYLVGAELGKRAAMRESARGMAILFGSFGAALLVSFQALGVQVAEGPEAKLPMVAAGMVCLALLAREKFFLAGAAGAVSFLAWQPGLIFVAVTLVGSLMAGEKKRAVAPALAGTVVPLALVGGYLAVNGALGPMFRQAFGANVNYLDEKKVAVGIFGVLASNVGKIWDVSLECSATETPLVYLGYAGMAVGTAGAVYFLRRTRDTRLLAVVLPLWLSGAALFGFSLLDLQKCSDVVPLLPYLALGGASALFLAVRLGGGGSARAVAVGSVVVLAVSVYGVSDAFFVPRQGGLEQQRALAKELDAQLMPGERAQQFGDTVFLVMTRRENATRFVHLGEKQGLGILTAEGVSMEQLVQQLEEADPRVITLSRAKNKEWAKPLYDWIEGHYMLGTSYGVTEGGTLKDTDVWWRK